MMTATRIEAANMSGMPELNEEGSSELAAPRPPKPAIAATIGVTRPIRSKAPQATEGEARRFLEVHQETQEIGGAQNPSVVPDY
jgi:hypothetical protein